MMLRNPSYTAPAPERSPLGRLARGYGVLQGASSLLLMAVWGLLRLLGTPSFQGSWLTAFLITPVVFVPVLVWWHAWVCRVEGPRRAWRYVAEIAFAANVVGLVLLQGLA